MNENVFNLGKSAATDPMPKPEMADIKAAIEDLQHITGQTHAALQCLVMVVGEMAKRLD